VIPAAFPEPWIDVVGDVTGGVPGDWYVTTLGDVITDQHWNLVEVLAYFAPKIAKEVIDTIVQLGDWPVIYEVGKVDRMRWLKCSIAGKLGATEAFVHTINFGKPGNDPTTTEAESLALAEAFAGYWATAVSDTGATKLSWALPAEVVYTEVGVTECEQTSSTAADGTGGNLSQSFPTTWYAWPNGAGPTVGEGLSLPYEVACAVTFQTAKRGPSGRGRIYLPPFKTGQMGADGKYQAGAPAAGARSVGLFFDAVKAGHDLVPLVVSRRRLVLNEVTSINVGIIPDAQRRRRRSQDEARVTIWGTP
jgi:hypothetical protein